MNLTARLCILLSAALLCSLACSGTAHAVNVRGYYRKDGTYVRPHYRSSPGRSSYSYSASSSSYSPSIRVTPTSPRTTEARTSARTTTRDSRSWSSLLGFDADDASKNSGSDAGEKPDAKIAKNESDASELFTKALAAASSKDYYLATTEYHRVIRHWPSTSSAKKARENLLALRADEPFRTWTSSDGRFTLVARFIKEEKKRVVLATPEGKTVRIDLEKLSMDDRRYVIMRRKRL
ncbi:SHD1 domain-containing protein [Lacipirellula sp.]|uniref:SHD1 domain-containing protein n=1 Tax=Lacipirellula sp. TaxID=2691419 RepID=UPI003D0F58A1